MTTWRKTLTKLGHKADERFDTLKYAMVRKLYPDREAYVRPYCWFGTPDTLIVRGRVLHTNGLRPPEEADRLWNNLLNSYRRFNSDEIPFAKLVVWAGNVMQQVTADGEGYFSAELSVPPTDTGWQTAHVQLLEPFLAEPIEATVRTPSSRAKVGIISDVDDTILQTFARNLIKVAQLTFLQNASTRLAFPGVAEFYQALQAGADGQQDNPIFYVSSSPWNLYDLLTDFMMLHHIPMGPLCLRDLGVDRDKLITTGHGSHKLEHIEQILMMYPHLSFILIGDSGQKDPEVYAEVARRFPERIEAIYIRDVADDARDATVVQISAELQTPMLLTPTSYEAAIHAAKIGRISQVQLTAIADTVNDDRLSIDELLG